MILNKNILRILSILFVAVLLIKPFGLLNQQDSAEHQSELEEIRCELEEDEGSNKKIKIIFWDFEILKSNFKIIIPSTFLEISNETCVNNFQNKLKLYVMYCTLKLCI